MYLDAIARARLESEWVTFLDIDEFLVLRGVDSIHAFMQQVPPFADSIHFNWLNFGSNGFLSRPAGSVLRQYTQRESSLSINTKHITRAALLTDDRIRAGNFPFWHGLSDPVWSRIQRINVVGDDVAGLLADHAEAAKAYLAASATRDAIIATAVVNHYALKSEEDFVLRANRGMAGEFAGQAAWRRHYDDGSFRGVLERMSGVEDTYLQKLSEARLPEISAMSSMPKQFLDDFRRVRVQHRLWTDDLLLGNDGRLHHATHGTTASYYLAGDVLHVRWDTYPADLFVRQGNVFVQVGIKQDAVMDMRLTQAASIDALRLPVAAVVLPVPESSHLVEVRPGSSDVDVFKAIFVGREYARPVLDYSVQTVVDLGANIGMASVYFALRHPNARIIAVEPEEANFRLLQRNTRACPNVAAMQAAIWPTDTTLHLRTTDLAGNALGDWGYQTEAAASVAQGDVAAISMPSLMRRYDINTIDLLKIDIEGAELDLFDGDTESWLPFTRCIIIETHERFRAGSDRVVTRKVLPHFDEQEQSGENRIFIRRS